MMWKVKETHDDVNMLMAGWEKCLNDILSNEFY